MRSNPSNQADGAPRPALVVGVGASAGGLEAVRGLLQGLPPDAGLAVIIVQHLAPTHESLLSGLLASHTAMRVVPVTEAMPLEPNTVFVIQPDTDLTVIDGRVLPSPREPTVRGARLPVDRLFRSLAQALGNQAAGIVLSGAGSDGVAGLRALRAVGALTLAQLPEEAGQSGMPQSAVDAGAADLVLPVHQMSRAIARFQELPGAAKAPEVDVAQEPPPHEPAPMHVAELIERATAILEAKGPFDLKHYKPATAQRRCIRRMALAGFDDTAAYLERLRTSPAERRALMRSLLIGVTDFFRNPAAFEALRSQVIEPLVAQSPEGTTLRAWVAGCATGEEAYSLGMLLLDAIDEQDKTLGLQIFATDMDEDALAVARAGLYATSLTEQVPDALLHRFLSPVDGRGYQVGQRLRDVMSFATHDLCNDPPFSRMDLVTCRNVLIYLQPATQSRVLELLHFALHPRGHLFLGASESTGADTGLFETVSKPHRIFRKTGVSRALSPSHTTLAARLRPADEPLRRHAPPRSPDDELAQAAKETLLQARVPPSVVVTGDGHILYTHGDLEPYVHFPRGAPRMELTQVLRDDLAVRVRGVLHEARHRGEAVSVVASSWKAGDGADRGTRVTASPAPAMGDAAMVVSFEPVDLEGPRGTLASPSREQESLLAHLEEELRRTREDLRATSDELQSANEELRASHEEAMTMNEELQSANEELEATTEELRSLNEELAAANARLKDKVAELERAHDDLSNLFESTKIATLFLDASLEIQRVSPEATHLLSLDANDTGQRVERFAHPLLQDDLPADASRVLKDLAPIQREVRSPEGRWYARQTLPYRTKSQHIGGVVVTFTDVTDLKHATEELRRRARTQAMIARLGLRALEMDDLQAFMDHLVREVQQTLDSDYCKALELLPGGQELFLRAGVGWADGLVGQATVSSDLDSQAGYTLATDEPVIVHDLATEKRFAGPALLRDHGVVSGLSCVIQGPDGPYGVLGAHTRTPRAFT
jgi:two-component system, chemotaxis family, CheB/CheR fusion protein